VCDEASVDAATDRIFGKTGPLIVRYADALELSLPGFASTVIRAADKTVRLHRDWIFLPEFVVD
jgi:hypothetical protein